MKKELINLAECLAQDQEFVKEFSKKKTVDEQYAFAQTKVKGYSKNEFVEFMKNLEEAYKLRSELSPEDLKAASGGSGGMAKLAALAMLGLTFTGGAMNMATSIPTFADTSAEATEFKKDIMTHLSYDYSDSTSCGNGGSKRIALKDTIKKIPESETIINEMCNSRKIKFSRKPGGRLSYTYWAMDFDSEVPEEIINKHWGQNDPKIALKAKEILLWFSGKELYPNDRDLQVNKNGGKFTNASYKLFLEETGKKFDYMDESVFSSTLSYVLRSLNRDRALSVVLRELGKVDLANKVMKNVNSFEKSGAQNLETLIQNVNFNYTNSSKNGIWRNTISHMLQNEAIRENVMNSITRDYESSPLQFSRSEGLSSTSWKFKIKEGSVINDDEERAVLKWLEGNDLYFDGNKLNGINFKKFSKFADSIELHKFYGTDKAAYSAADDVDDTKFDSIIESLTNNLNKARAMRGALEDTQKKVNNLGVKKLMAGLQNTVMPNY